MKATYPGRVRAYGELIRTSTANYFSAFRQLKQAVAATDNGIGLQPLVGLRENWNPETLAYEGIILEPERTNYVLNNDNLTNTVQTRTLPYGTFTLSFYGTGSVKIEGPGITTFILSGSNLTTPTFGVDSTVSAGSAPCPVFRVSQAFFTTGGSVVVTVTGTVRFTQIEQGSYPTSIIVTTGSAATRAKDLVYTYEPANTAERTALSCLLTGTVGLAPETTPSLNAIFPSFVVLYPSEYLRYTSGNSYVVNQKAVHQGQVYTALQTGVLGTPLYLGTTADWRYTGPDNPLLPFTITDSTPAICKSNSTCVLCVRVPGNSNSVTLTGISASKVKVVVNDKQGSIKTYNYNNNPKELYIDFTESLPSYYDNIPTEFLGSAGDLDGDAATIVTVFFESSYETGDIRLGKFTVGNSVEIGQAQYGVSTSITDYSKKNTDEFGNVSFVKRAFSKKISCRLLLDKSAYNTVLQLFYDLRATPTSWVVTDDENYSKGSIIYGYYKDFSMDIAYPTMCACSLEIEGLT